MSNVLAIARRELGSYYGSFMYYAVAAAFVGVMGLFFTLNVVYARSADLTSIFQTVYTVLLLIMAPMLTMRLVAEEQRTGTIEVILTAPVRDVEFVLGKFLGSVGLLVSMLLPTLLFPLALALYGHPDRGEIIGGYAGALLFGAASFAVGLFISSLTSNQVAAAVLSFVVLLVLWVIDGLSGVVGGGSTSILSYVALYSHFTDMTRGIISARDVTYFVSFTLAALFLTVRSIESRRWR